MSRRCLARAGFIPAVVTTPGEALGALAGREAGLFVVDLTMPGLEVPAVARALAAGGRPPVVFLLDRYAIRPRSLARGQPEASPARRAWLSRPFSPRALADAVTALARPASPSAPGSAAAAGLPAGIITPAGREVTLTRSEQVILATLAERPGRPRTREELLAALEAWRGKRPAGRAIDVYVTQLRAKLGAASIRTVRGLGYALSPRGGAPPFDSPEPGSG
jgi:two-component system OmpR family response regulator/two-component system response regulator QseB